MRHLAVQCFVVASLVACSHGDSDSNKVSKILSQLDTDKMASDRSNATIRLQQMGTNAFPLLVAEMNSFKWDVAEEKDQRVLIRTQRLRAAFEAFGTNLAPLTGEFVTDLDTNHNFVSAIQGLVAMGEVGAPYLLAAMTNREAPVRLNAVAAIMQVATNADVAKLAVPNLILLLNDNSDITRSLSAEALGLYCTDPADCIPALLALARSDSSLVVRSQCVKAVGRIARRIGSISPNTKSILESISREDQSEVVRLGADRVLEGKLE
jgi:HEAT repeat protein